MPCAKMLVVTFFLAVLVPGLVLSSKKARKLHLHRSNDSVSIAFTRAVSGIDAKTGEFSWQAQLLDKNKQTFCGATLTPLAALTDAACVHERKTYTVRSAARISKNDPAFATSGQDFLVFHPFNPPEYNSNIQPHGVALLALVHNNSDALSSVKTVKLPGLYHAPATACVVTGFDATNMQMTTFPESLQKVSVSIVGHDECEGFDKSFICAKKSDPGYTTPCVGNSVGSLVCKHNKDGSGDYFLYGLGTTPCRNNLIDGYIDVVKQLPWIKGTLNLLRASASATYK